ncbi:ABC transporter permease [Lysobacter niabensis]|uniref:ABC transporter permease n=1 Tax=Agrilutibacter niabensis TaxID=380628 RepID=UPI0036080B23
MNEQVLQSMKKKQSDTGRPAGGFSLLNDTRSSIRRPEFWTFAAWLDLITKYRRSRLGILWMFLPPAATVFLLGYFYSGLSGRDPFSFMPYMGMGYILWRFITQVINESSSAMLSHRAFIMDGRTRFTDYVLRCISKAALYFLAALLVVSVAFLMSPEASLWGMLTLVATLPIFLINLFGLGIALALLGARYPDTHEVTTTVFIFGFLLTPILWYPEHIAHGSPRWVLMQANPAYHLIEFVRGPLLGRPLTLTTCAFVTATTIALPVLAAVLYRRYARFVPLWI